MEPHRRMPAARWAAPAQVLQLADRQSAPPLLPALRSQQQGEILAPHRSAADSPMAFSLWSRKAGGGPALRGGIRAIACKDFSDEVISEKIWIGHLVFNGAGGVSVALEKYPRVARLRPRLWPVSDPRYSRCPLVASPGDNPPAGSLRRGPLAGGGDGAARGSGRQRPGPVGP
jgi:hypothetical protein